MFDPIHPSRRRPTRVSVRLAAAMAGIVVLSSCGGDGTAPIVPQSLVIVSGGDQTGPAGDVTNEDFTVRVLGSDGQPFAGASVSWAVTTGGGSVTPATVVSDAMGLASARLRLGVAFGANSATATVSGVQPVSFGATAINPCDFLRPIAVGEATAGTLAFPDCPLPDNTLIDYYELDLAQQQRLDIALDATNFDAFLFFFDDVDVIAADDDGGGGTNALLPILLPAGAYVIGANSFQPATGSYDLSVAATAEDVTNCDVVWIPTGITTAQQLSTSDCDAGTNWYADAFAVFLRAGVTLTATEQSTAFDALVEVHNGTTGELLATDDNGGGGTNARVDYMTLVDIVVVVVTTSAAAGQSGAYSMTVVSSGPLAADGALGSAPTSSRRTPPMGQRSRIALTPRWWPGSPRTPGRD